jgi:hypothetical protein
MPWLVLLMSRKSIAMFDQSLIDQSLIDQSLIDQSLIDQSLIDLNFEGSYLSQKMKLLDS